MARISLPQPGIPLATIEAAGETDLLALDSAQLLALYREHGALLLRGFALDLDIFARFARSFCPTAVLNESPGRAALGPGGTIQSVNLGDDPFPLHPELSREPWKPDAAFFACLSPPSAGGETTICDGIALAQALPDDVREGLKQRRLVYPMPTWPGLLEFWLGTATPDDALLANPPAHCPYSFRRTADGSIARLFSRPALHRPIFAEGPAFGNFLLFARFHGRRGDFPLLDDYTPVPEAWLQAIKAAGDDLEYAVPWREGDLLMLDNTRFMHGRRAILDAAERRIATFFGYLADAPVNPEEPPSPLWREADFAPPANPALSSR